MGAAKGRSKERAVPPKRRFFRRPRLWLYGTALFGLALIAGEVIASVRITRWLRRRLPEVLHLPTRLGGCAVGIFMLRVDAGPVFVGQPDERPAFRKAPWMLEAERVEVNASLWNFLVDTIEMDRVWARGLRAVYIVDEKGESNASVAWDLAHAHAPESERARHYRIRRLEVDRGAFEIYDHALDGGFVAHLLLDGLDLRVLGATDVVRPVPPDPKRTGRGIDWCCKVEGEGRLAGERGGGPLTLSGRFGPLTGALDIDWKADLPGVDARDLETYAVPIFSVVPERGTVDLSLEIEVRRDRFQNSYLRFSTHGFAGRAHPYDPGIARDVLHEIGRADGNYVDRCQVRGSLTEPQIVTAGPILKIGLRRLPGGIIRAPFRMVRWLFGRGGRAQEPPGEDVPPEEGE